MPRDPDLLQMGHTSGPGSHGYGMLFPPSMTISSPVSSGTRQTPGRASRKPCRVDAFDAHGNKRQELRSLLYGQVVPVRGLRDFLPGSLTLRRTRVMFIHGCSRLETA